MSELVAHKADVTIPVYGTIADAEVYLKSEADKVIAELEEKLKNSRNGRKFWRKEWIIAYEECRHQKYKRCLAMARWCEEVDLFGGYTSNYWMRWRNKWLELAEEFKEAK